MPSFTGLRIVAKNTQVLDSFFTKFDRFRLQGDLFHRVLPNQAGVVLTIGSGQTWAGDRDVKPTTAQLETVEFVEIERFFQKSKKLFVQQSW